MLKNAVGCFQHILKGHARSKIRGRGRMMDKGSHSDSLEEGSGERSASTDGNGAPNKS